VKTANLTVTNKTGLHARPASLFVEEAGNYEAKITLTKGDQEANGKSIMGVMSLGISQGTEITIQAEGEDEAEAVAALTELIENEFEK
jgi:phosphocarrier protein